MQLMNKDVNNRQGEESYHNNNIQSSKSPHFWWLVTLMSLIIIALLAFILSKRILCSKIIGTYLSFAGLILSITMSIFAIIYTYVSNVQIQAQFEKIDNAAKHIIDASSKMIETAVDISSSIKDLRNKQDDLKKSFDNRNSEKIEKDKNVQIPDNSIVTGKKEIHQNN